MGQHRRGGGGPKTKEFVQRRMIKNGERLSVGWKRRGLSDGERGTNSRRRSELRFLSKQEQHCLQMQPCLARLEEATGPSAVPLKNRGEEEAWLGPSSSRKCRGCL